MKADTITKFQLGSISEWCYYYYKKLNPQNIYNYCHLSFEMWHTVQLENVQ